MSWLCEVRPGSESQAVPSGLSEEAPRSTLQWWAGGGVKAQTVTRSHIGQSSHVVSGLLCSVVVAL